MDPANDPINEEIVINKEIISRKDWREISKLQGLFYSFAIVLFYTIARWWIFTQHGYYLPLIYISVILFFIGFALGLFENIEPGTSDTLVYCGKLLKGKRKEWEDGYVFLPSPVPFMHRLKFRPMWSLLKKHWKVKKRDENNGTFKHNVEIKGFDQHRVNTDATLLEAAVYQGGKISWYWFWSMDGDAPFAFQEFGLKMIMTAVLFDCFNLSVTGVVNVYEYVSSSGKQAIAEMQKSSQGTKTSTKQTPKQEELAKPEFYQMTNGNFVVKDGDRRTVIPPTFPMNSNNNSNQQTKCRWTEADWKDDLVYSSYLKVEELAGCIDFHPPPDKGVGMLFENRPTKTDGDFTISNRAGENICVFNSGDDCINDIESHLNEVLVFKGSHIYIETGK